MYIPRKQESKKTPKVILTGLAMAGAFALQVYGTTQDIPQMKEDEAKAQSTMTTVYAEKVQAQEIEIKALRTLLQAKETKLASRGAEIDLIKEKTISVINSRLTGLLKGQGKNIFEAGQKFQIDSKLLTAIILLEVGKNCNSDVLKNAHNVAGTNWREKEQIRDKTGKTVWVKNTRPAYGWYIKYSSFEESINDFAQRLRWWYLDMNLKTIPEIGLKYAPPDDVRNGIGGMDNTKWVKNVTDIYNELKREVER